jgi:hypothetical protein
MDKIRRSNVEDDYLEIQPGIQWDLLKSIKSHGKYNTI